MFVSKKKSSLQSLTHWQKYALTRKIQPTPIYKRSISFGLAIQEQPEKIKINLSKRGYSNKEVEDLFVIVDKLICCILDLILIKKKKCNRVPIALNNSGELPYIHHTKMKCKKKISWEKHIDCKSSHLIKCNRYYIRWRKGSDIISNTSKTINYLW